MQAVPLGHVLIWLPRQGDLFVPIEKEEREGRREGRRERDERMDV